MSSISCSLMYQSSSSLSLWHLIDLSGCTLTRAEKLNEIRQRGWKELLQCGFAGVMRLTGVKGNKDAKIRLLPTCIGHVYLNKMIWCLYPRDLGTQVLEVRLWVSKITGSFMVWFKGEGGRWLAVSMRWEKKKALQLLLSGEEQTFFWLLLWPLVISKILWKFHFSASKRKSADSGRSTTLPSNKHKMSSFQNPLFFSVATCDLTHCNSWQTTQYSTKDENRKMCHDRGMEESCLKNRSFFFCDLLSCLRSF